MACGRLDDDDEGVAVGEEAGDAASVEKAVFRALIKPKIFLGFINYINLILIVMIIISMY